MPHDPVPELLHVTRQNLPGLGVQPEVVVQEREFLLGDMEELAQPGVHQVIHDRHRRRIVDPEEVLHDQDAVVHLTLVLDLLLVREQVVEQRGVVRRRVLQGAQRAAAVDLLRHLLPVTEPATDSS